jgi:nitrate reductase gamma subunit
MHLTSLSQIIVAIALVFSIAVFAMRLRTFLRLSRPVDLASPKGNPALGILYAYTLVMAPWAKESTRRHWLAYLRGVAFHLGILMGFTILLGSPWFTKMDYSFRFLLAIASALGAVLGLVGLAARLMESNLRKLSVPDDYFAVVLVSLFLLTASIGMLIPTALPLFYLISALLLIYAPFSKIRHCLYYAFSRRFFGKFFGSRNIIPHQHPHGSVSTIR